MLSSILTFGRHSPNAKEWRTQLSNLGVTTVIAVEAKEPNYKDMIAFFAQPANWIYFSGHHIDGHLFNNYPEPATAGVRFSAGRVHAYAPSGSGTLRKGGEFKLHERKPQVLFWGGCNVCESRETVRTIRALFNNPLILGYSEQSGIPVTRKIFTGIHKLPGQKPNPKLRGDTDFFEELASGPLDDMHHVRESWLRSVRANVKNVARRDMFRAIDPDGKEWLPGADRSTPSGRDM